MFIQSEGHPSSGAGIMNLRGVEFGEPVGLEGIRPGPGVYLVCTESSGGMRVIGAYWAEDMASDALANPWRDRWAEHDDGGLFAYCSESPFDAVDGPAVCADIVTTRFYDVPCYEAPREDW